MSIFYQELYTLRRSRENCKRNAAAQHKGTPATSWVYDVTLRCYFDQLGAGSGIRNFRARLAAAAVRSVPLPAAATERHAPPLHKRTSTAQQARDA
jgi:hypothetical protein